MEVSYSALDAEAGLSYDTTVRVSVQPNRYYPDYVVTFFGKTEWPRSSTE